MIPMMKVTSSLNLLNSRLGLVTIYLSFGMPFTIFLFHGFVRTSVPKEIEEAAVLDGCSSLQTFFRVVLPILSPMVATVTILHAFWIWNDFLLPLLVIFDPEKRTIPLAIFSFFGRYSSEWNLALATLTMGMVPIVIFFLVLQKYIISGIAAGSLKG
jgi:raffinose/stachyose/melibiose transport system permease protein